MNSPEIRVMKSKAFSNKTEPNGDVLGLGFGISHPGHVYGIGKLN